MSASYPTSVHVYTTKVDGPAQYISASHINDLQLEIAAVEDALLNGIVHKVAINAGTLTSDARVLDLSAAWNAAGVAFTGIKLNVTLTASAAASLLADFQADGVSRFSVSKNGAVVASDTVQAAGFKVGATAGVDGSFTTADGKTITVTKGIVTAVA